MHSLRTRILIIVLFFLAFIGSAFLLYSLRTTINYKQLRLDGIEKTVEFETERINKIIAQIEHGAVDMANDSLLYYISQSEEVGITSILEYLHSYSVAIGGGFWFEPYAYNEHTLRAGLYGYVDQETHEICLDEFDITDYDYHNFNWYREIADVITHPYEVAWTKPYVDDTTYKLMTTAGAGVYSAEGKLIAISTIDWEIDDVVRQLTAIKPTENSFIILCVPKQDYIIFSTRISSLVGASLDTLAWDIDADFFTLEGIAYLSFGRYMDNGWLLSVQIPENEIFAEVESQNSRFTLIIALSSILMLYLAYLLISKLINAPIKKLTRDVSQLALGNLDIHIDITSKDELGLLAQTFNQMTADLKASIEENARERAEKERIGTELSIAKEIQASMLPCVFPPFPERPEFEIYATMLPAKEVGGDFYDFFLIDDNNLAVVIGDVSGKGVPAALFMVITKTLINNNACSGKCPREVLETVNDILCENNEACMFVTAFIGYYNLLSGRFTYVNAGHNPPIIKKSAGTSQFLTTKPRLILGWKKGNQYQEEEIYLSQGDAIYLYTDGVSEAMNVKMELFGEARLLKTVQDYEECSPTELLPAIKKEIDNFTQDAEQTDDITMLAFKANQSILGAMNRLTLTASADNLNTILDFVNEELQRHDCPPGLINNIDIAVEEIFINIANYAYKAQPGDVCVYISIEETVIIRFEDTGQPYNPLEQDDPDLSKPLIERDIGGLGIYLVKKLMDEVTYSYVGNKNILVLSKKLST